VQLPRPPAESLGGAPRRGAGVRLNPAALERAIGESGAGVMVPRDLAPAIVLTLGAEQFLLGNTQDGGAPADSFTPVGVGRVRTVAPANPTVGTDWSIVVPAGVTWQLESVFARLTCSATVANRVPRLVIRDPQSVTWVFMPSNATLTASQAGDIQWLKASNDRQAPAGLLEWLVNLPPVFVPSGWTLLTITNALAAGDQWSSIKLMPREFPVG